MYKYPYLEMKRVFEIRLSFIKALLIVPFALFLNSCGDSGGGGLNIYSAADDVKLGKQIDDQFKLDANKAKYPMYPNPAATLYLQNIVDELAKSKSLNYANVFKYTIQIVNDPKTVNAFATAGGYVYVYTGLLRYCENKAELASVISHEMAHNDRRHSTQRMTKEYGIGVLASVILGDNPEQWKAMLANITKNLGILKNSRDDEFEADKYAYLYLKDTKYYPAGMQFFFDRILASEKSGNRPSELEMLFATHPYSQDRIDRVIKYANDDKIPAPTEQTIMKDEYSQFKLKFNF